MSAAFTPGPWLHRAKNDSVWTAPPAGSLYKFGDHILTFHEEDGPSEEDLALILIAPELFGLASRLAALSDGLNNGNSSAENEACKLAEQAKALVARAMGEQP